MDGWMDGCEWMDGCGWMDGWMGGCPYRWMDGSMSIQMDEWMDGQKDGYRNAVYIETLFTFKKISATIGN